jgi:hypothetical protein
MGYYGISIEGIVSEMGVLGQGENFCVKEEILIQGLISRFDVSEDEAKRAIGRSVKYKAIMKKEDNNYTLRKN